MTYEEFIKGFDQFGLMKTPDGIAFGKQQYELYLFKIEDDKFFEPAANVDNKKDLILIAEKHLQIRFNSIAEDRLYFWARPSFEPQYLLIIEKSGSAYALRHCVLKENFWLRFEESPALATADIIISEGVLSKLTGDQIFKVVEDGMKAAKKPSGKWATMDGVEYRLSKIVGDQRVDVKKHSSSEDIMPGRIVNLLKTVIKLTQPNAGVDIERELALKLELIKAE